MVNKNNKHQAFNNSTDNISLDFPTTHSTHDRKHYDESHSQNEFLVEDSTTNHGGDNSVSGVGTSKTNASSDGAYPGGSGGRLSEAESRKVFRLRVIVIVVLICISLVVSGAVFKITVQGEIDEFETEYDGAATKVIDAFEDIMNKMGSVAGLGVSFTSQGQRSSRSTTTTSWPFVSLDDFHLRANNVLQLSGALMVGMSPVLRGSLFRPWDTYVENPENQIWIEESLAHQGARGFPIPPQEEEEESGRHYNVINENRVVDVMHYYKGGTVIPEVPGREWYLPMWQTCPYVAKGLVNNNLLRYENTTVAVHHVYESENAVLGRMITAPPGSITSPDPDTALLATLRSAQKAEAAAATNVGGGGGGGGTTTSVDYLGDPMTDLFIPVFDTVDIATRKVVGVLNALIHWKSYFRNVLPNNIHGIVVVLEYTCHNDDAPVAGDNNNQVEGRSRRRAQQETPTTTSSSSSSIRNNERNMVTTFTIIEHVTDAPSTVPLEDRAPTQESASSSSPYWDAEAHTPLPTTSYWNNNNADQSSNGTFISYATKPPAEEGEQQQQLPPSHPSSTIREDQETEEPIDMSSSLMTDQKFGSGESSYFTYIIEGSDAQVLGPGDLHDPSFDDHMRRGSFVPENGATTLADGTVTGIPIDPTCAYNIYVYPSQSFYLEYASTQPLEITLVVVSLFIFAIITFLFYNRMVERRQTRILKKATQSTAIVSSLFPKNVRDRLLAGGSPEALGAPLALGNKSRLKGFMAGGGEANEQDSEAPPIADLFPHCTVFFADIAGFTAWSSTREPSQVFILLQAVYQAFDQLAKRRRVFKVETIGDCYMAVTGLPDPQDSHASIMVRFSYDCITKMREVTKRLESQLGPDTTELSMRIGLHSGPVTAGVLRGDRARFQLFGDTVNTASRMESTGIRGKIQVSEATANILREHGRGDWLIPRADSVKAKGKGVLKTYWANPRMRANLNSKSSMSVSSAHGDDETSDSTDEVGTVLQQSQLRLVDWIVKLLSDDIRRILFVRQKAAKVSKNAAAPSYFPPEGSTCMDEVKEVIHMPKFDASKAQSEAYKKIQIDSEITRELSDLVAGIAQMYKLNPFHNFEHACHVTMSVNKLIRRIVAPELSAEEVDGFGNANSSRIAAHLHDYTYGINSDPLAMFAMTFSALIHDVDHRGISNLQLAIEFPDMATKYHKKSIAEQNSLDLAWDLLMEPRFANLRKYIFVSEMELMRFRQLIVNIVLATDIFDKELNDLRKTRWKRAFSGEEAEKEDTPQSDLKATIVIEHIIQASDVSHTMQHWHVYQKWNKCLFREMHSAYKAGRLAKDPASFWYKGEIGFFDNYIIPLAKKLKDCGVFGVSSDEYLNYAVQNRAEWAERGAEIVAGLVEEVTKAEVPKVEQAPTTTKKTRANSFEVDESMSSRGRGRASVMSR